MGESPLSYQQRWLHEQCEVALRTSNAFLSKNTLAKLILLAKGVFTSVASSNPSNQEMVDFGQVQLYQTPKQQKIHNFQINGLQCLKGFFSF